MSRLPRSVRSLTALVVAAPLLAGCGATDAGGSDGTRVIASFYPLEYVAQRVAGEHAEVEALTSPGQEPHDLELTFKQTADVVEADLVVYAGGFQPSVDDAVAQAGEETAVDAAGLADEAAVAAAGDGAFHSDDDPHFWLDPTRLVAGAVAVQGRLAEVDPEHAEDYAANLEALRADLEDLDAEISEGLASCARDTIVVSHDAFGYFSDRYGIGVEPINGLSPDAEPSPAHLAELAELIESKGITTVFSETLASPELADRLAEDLGLRTAVLDPIEGLADSTADEDYLSLMRANLDAIREANDCS